MDGRADAWGGEEALTGAPRSELIESPNSLTLSAKSP